MIQQGKSGAACLISWQHHFVYVAHSAYSAYSVPWALGAALAVHDCTEYCASVEKCHCTLPYPRTQSARTVAVLQLDNWAFMVAQPIAQRTRSE